MVAGLILVAIGANGCGRQNSISVVSPVAPQTGNRWRAPGQGSTTPVNVVLQFNSRAVVNNANFAVELHGVTNQPGSNPPIAQCGPLLSNGNLVPVLQPPPVAGGTSSMRITIANDYCLRVHADMQPSQAFDSAGYDYFFRVNAQ